MHTHWNTHTHTHKHLKTLPNARKTEAVTLRGREAYTSTAQLSVWRMTGERWVHSLKGLISQPQLPPHTAMNGKDRHTQTHPLLLSQSFTYKNTLTVSYVHSDARSLVRRKTSLAQRDLPAITNCEFLLLATRHHSNTTINKSTDRERRQRTGRGSIGGRETEWGGSTEMRCVM